MEAFIDKGYPDKVLTVLNDIRVYMKVVLLSDMSKLCGTKIANWALRSEVNINHKWIWPPQRVPTVQNMRVWRDCIRGTFVKDMNDLMVPTSPQGNAIDQVTYPLFNYDTMARQHSLLATISQYPPEL